MSKVIIDSSTIFSFNGLVSGWLEVSRLNHNDRSKDACEIIENVIEALLLYDEVCFDNDTMEHDLHIRGQFSLVELPYCSLIKSKLGTLGEYEDILTNMNIAPNKINDIALTVESDWESFMDPHGNFGCTILKPEDVYYDQLCREFVNKYSSAMTSNDELIDRMVFYSIIRFLYYQRLCAYNDAELVIHPNRGIISLSLSDYKKLFTSSIFKNFESAANTQCYRFSRWLPVNFNTFRLPLVANYVMKNVDWNDHENFLETIVRLRNYPEIKDFREGLNEMLSLIASDDVSGISKLIQDLDIAVNYWSKYLHGFPNTHERIVTLGQTNFNVGLNMGVASIGIGQSSTIECSKLVDNNTSTSSKMLTFIHDTIKCSLKKSI